MIFYLEFQLQEFAVLSSSSKLVHAFGGSLVRPSSQRDPLPEYLQWDSSLKTCKHTYWLQSDKEKLHLLQGIILGQPEEGHFLAKVCMKVTRSYKGKKKKGLTHASAPLHQ